jgi:DNA-binding MarR family transcriptional regulator
LVDLGGAARDEPAEAVGRAGDDGLHYLTTSAQVRRAVDEYLARSGLSLSGTKILQVLARRGPVKQAQLAVELGLAARSITQAVEGMERDGPVRRSPATGAPRW